MASPQTLLEGLCSHALALHADAIEVEYDEGFEFVYARQGATGISIAKYRSSGKDARELRRDLYAALKKKRSVTVLNGRRCILKIRVYDSFGEDGFHVAIESAPALDASALPRLTAKQGQYLAYIHNYSKIHGQAPAESDLQRYFGISAPAVHEMIKRLERSGLIARTPGSARSIRVLTPPEFLPRL